MVKRIINFNAGPSALPFEMLEEAAKGIVEFNNTGMSILEISHRSKDFEGLLNECNSKMKKLFGIPENYKILYLGGGASTQFATIPMNFLPKGKKAWYSDTGVWSSKAIKEAKLQGEVGIAFSSQEIKFARTPKASEIKYDKDAAYLHITSNNTIYGTQQKEFPDTGSVPLICDMSSDIMSREVDVSKFSFIYAGAQKNLGPAGVTIVIIKPDMLEKINPGIPIILNYKTQADENSLYNTPPVYGIYCIKLVLDWIEKTGGVGKIEQINNEKGKLLYGMMDKYPDYFKGTVNPDSRSLMNVCFRLPTEQLEEKFIAEAKTAGMGGLKGHRSVGGVRVSMYNAVSLENVKALVTFMEEFHKNNK